MTYLLPYRLSLSGASLNLFKAKIPPGQLGHKAGCRPYSVGLKLKRLNSLERPACITPVLRTSSRSQGVTDYGSRRAVRLLRRMFTKGAGVLLVGAEHSESQTVSVTASVLALDTDCKIHCRLYVQLLQRWPSSTLDT